MKPYNYIFVGESTLGNDGLKYKSSFMDDTKYKSDTLEEASISGFSWRVEEGLAA